jgi:hypothetical protein
VAYGLGVFLPAPGNGRPYCTSRSEPVCATASALPVVRYGLQRPHLASAVAAPRHGRKEKKGRDALSRSPSLRHHDVLQLLHLYTGLEQIEVEQGRSPSPLQEQGASQRPMAERRLDAHLPPASPRSGRASPPPYVGAECSPDTN